MLFPLVLLGQENEKITSSVDLLLKSFVEDGSVNYEAIAMAKPELDQLYSNISSSSLEFDSQDAEKAFLINTYNLFVIKQVVDNYPLNSPQEKADFFTEDKFSLGGKKVSLNSLEKGIIFKKFPDPRLHFALVCAAKGCPKIRSEAYTSSNVETLLDEQSKRALNDPSFLNYDAQQNELNISSIFDWYKADFGNNQESRIAFINNYVSNAIPNDAKFKFINYDWTLNGRSAKKKSAGEEKSNLQLFTPSALFTKGQYEINAFNSIYSQQSLRNESGELINLNETQSFFTSMLMFTTGVSKNTRFNVGLDLFISKARYDADDVSALKVLSGSDDALFNQTVLSYVAPRIKWVPFKKVPRLSVQSALWIPVNNDLEASRFIAHDRYTWFTQIFFDKNLWNDFQIFLEADLLYRFANSELHEYDFFRTPASAFLSYFPTSNSTIYVFSQFSPRFETTLETIDQENGELGEQFGLSSWFTQFGVGGKYQLTDALGIELSYSNFALSRSEGAGHTLNFGIRYIHR